MAETSDDQPITRSVLREEFTVFAQNLMPAFQAIEEHIESTETKLLTEIHRLDTKIDGVEARLTQRIETAAVSFRKLEADVASLTRRMEDVERKLNPSQ